VESVNPENPFYDKVGEARVTSVAKYLPKNLWQNLDIARESGKLNITEQSLNKGLKTKNVSKACIFFRESDLGKEFFACTLHHLAKIRGKHFVKTKPDSCWQFPFRRSWGSRNIGDKEYGVIVIGEYVREAWGEGGADTNGCCSSNGEARNGAEPVHASVKTELTKLTNKSACEQLVKSYQVRIQEQKSRN